jgi:tetratricopeptide (TPR) repeat protein
MGDIARELGRTEEARRHYQAYLAITEAIAAEHPEGQLTKWNLAQGYERLGDVNHSLLGDGAIARDCYLKCLAIWQDLAAGPIRVPNFNAAEVKANLAAANRKLANLSLMLGDPGGAWAQYQRYLELQFGLTYGTPREALAAAAGPAGRQLPAGQAMRLGAFAFHLGDGDTARGWIDRVLGQAREDSRPNPNSLQAGDALAAALSHAGDLELMLGDAGKARGLYAEAHELFARRAAQNPAAAGPRQSLSQSHYQLGTACRRLGEAAADRHFRECLALRQALAKDDPRNANKQIDLMLALARCGRHTEAAAGADELGRRAPRDPRIRFYVACIYALSSGATAGEADGGAALRRRYLDRALENLTEALACGWRDGVALQTDPDLDPVRGEPRFKELLAQIHQGGARADRGDNPSP